MLETVDGGINEHLTIHFNLKKLLSSVYILVRGNLVKTTGALLMVESMSTSGYILISKILLSIVYILVRGNLVKTTSALHDISRS